LSPYRWADYALQRIQDGHEKKKNGLARDKEIFEGELVIAKIYQNAETIQGTNAEILVCQQKIQRLNDKITECEKEIPWHEKKEKRVRTIRYVWSECYIFLWLFLSIIFFKYNQIISLSTAYFLMLRIVEMLNKELGVILFDVAKITKSPSNSSAVNVSSVARVIILAFANYITAGFLFALLYLKTGNHFTYIADANHISLPFHVGTITSAPINALVESFSILFSFSPLYTPAPGTSMITLGESTFCFAFAIIIITTFINMIKMKPTMK